MPTPSAGDVPTGCHRLAIHPPRAVWPIQANDDRPVGLLVHVRAQNAEVPTPQVGIGTADEMRCVNEQLLLAGLKAQEQAQVEITLRAAAEAALKVRDEFISIAAHELRMPLTGSKASTQLALRTLEAWRVTPAGWSRSWTISS